MAGSHAERGDTTHRIISGEKPEVGLRVWDYDLEPATIIKLGGDHGMAEPCGWYCKAWHLVRSDNGNEDIANCERMVTRHPVTGELPPPAPNKP